MEIVVADLYQLGKDGNQFSKSMKKLIRSKTKQVKSHVDEVNARWEAGGRIYEIDEAATQAWRAANKGLPGTSPVTKATKKESGVEALKARKMEMELAFDKEQDETKLQEIEREISEITIQIANASSGTGSF